MNARRMVPLILVLLLSLVALPAATGAQEAPPQPAASPQAISASISPLLSYQGRVVEGGVPVTGDRTMTFSLWTTSTLGAKVWSEGPGTVAVSDGLFTATLGDTTALPLNQFASDLWLEVQVGATTLPRQRLMGAPYAMSLAPGAQVSGSKPSSEPAVVTVENASTGAALRGYSNSGWGVYAESGTGSAINAANNGSLPTLKAANTNAAGAAAQLDSNGSLPTLKVANTNAAGAAAQLDSNGTPYTAMVANSYAGSSSAGGVLRLTTNGGPVILAENQSATKLFSVEPNGDATQSLSAGGLVKLAIALHCGNAGYSTRDRYFTSAAVLPTVTSGATAGRCTINTGIDLSTRFWTITPTTPTGGSPPASIDCNVSSVNNQQFDCALVDVDDFGLNSSIQILVY